MVNDGLRNSHPLQHAFGEFPQLCATRLRQADTRQNLGYPALALARINSRQLRKVIEEFVGGQVVVEIRLFRQKTDLRFHLGIAPISSQNFGRPPSREDQAHEQFQSGRFACAVWAEVSEDLALWNGQRQRPECDLGTLPPEAREIRLLQRERFNSSHLRYVCSLYFARKTG